MLAVAPAATIGDGRKDDEEEDDETGREEARRAEAEEEDEEEEEAAARIPEAGLTEEGEAKWTGEEDDRWLKSRSIVSVFTLPPPLAFLLVLLPVPVLPVLVRLLLLLAWTAAAAAAAADTAAVTRSCSRACIADFSFL